MTSKNRGRGGRNPKEFMNQLVVLPPKTGGGGGSDGINADFGSLPPAYLDPVQFCLAVINGDLETLRACGVVEVPTMEHKLVAARVAAKYTNQAKPIETITKHAFSWQESITAAEQRVQALRMKVDEEDGQRAGPDTIN